MEKQENNAHQYILTFLVNVHCSARFKYSFNSSFHFIYIFIYIYLYIYIYIYIYVLFFEIKFEGVCIQDMLIHTCTYPIRKKSPLVGTKGG